MALNIAGFSFSMPQFNFFGMVQNIALWGAIGLIVIGLGIWAFIAIKNKGTYRYPVTLRVRRANGTKVRYDLKGAIISGKGGVRGFKVKIPRVFKKFDLGYMPDFSLADSNDRLSFLQEGDATMWQQTKEELVTEKHIVDEQGNTIEIIKLIVEPIPTDTKTTTYNNLQNTRELMDLKKMTVYGISIVAIIIMVIVHLISLFIQTRIRCPTP
jgi:hypothetical protein